jgi:hypothetical protein
MIQAKDSATRPFARFCERAIAIACLVLQAYWAAAQGPPYHWKLHTDAQVKLDGKPPLAWNVYQTDKKKEQHLVLVLLGRRYLALDLKAKRVYQVFPTDLRAQGKDFESDELFKKERLLPTNDWLLRDVGPAEMIRLTLGDYGRTLEVMLPHPLDLRAFY